MKTGKKKKKGLLIALLLLLAAVLTVGGWFFSQWLIMKKAPAPETAAEAAVSAALQEARSAIAPGDSPEALSLAQTMAAELNCRLTGTALVQGRQAELELSLTYLDGEKLLSGLNEEINALLPGIVDGAERASDVYDEEDKYLPEIKESAFSQALALRLEAPSPYISEQSFSLRLRYSKGAWTAENGEELSAALLSAAGEAQALRQRLMEESTAELTYVKKLYKIDEKALSGPVPDPACYGSTEDPQQIYELLQRPEAQDLIGGQSLVWNGDIERIPGTTIEYYLDETILVLVWQEVEAQAVGTFAEVFIADGSQLRRRIAGDQFESFDFMTTSQFAQATNGVLTLGGDFYNHGRNCGIVVYDRQILRFDPDTCDCCYITSGGDMLFSYRGQFKTQEEAQAFVDENDVLFSLCFGPVLIDGGQDVSPEYYQWGEINDHYARSVLGLMGDKHYLTMNINCQQPGYYYLATLRQATDAVLERGCIKAYALDGGQTATTVFNGRLINPVQFGWEKTISDVIYFATAIP